MSNKTTDKFENMSYEAALGKLSELISQLESGKLSFDDTLIAYKEAFEYYTYLNDYLKTAGEKIRNMNDTLSSSKALLED